MYASAEAICATYSTTIDSSNGPAQMAARALMACASVPPAAYSMRTCTVGGGPVSSRHAAKMRVIDGCDRRLRMLTSRTACSAAEAELVVMRLTTWRSPVSTCSHRKTRACAPSPSMRRSRSGTAAVGGAVMRVAEKILVKKKGARGSPAREEPHHGNEARTRGTNGPLHTIKQSAGP